jgi:hypothetical protein
MVFPLAGQPEAAGLAVTWDIGWRLEAGPEGSGPFKQARILHRAGDPSGPREAWNGGEPPEVSGEYKPPSLRILLDTAADRRVPNRADDAAGQATARSSQGKGLGVYGRRGPTSDPADPRHGCRRGPSRRPPTTSRYPGRWSVPARGAD